MLQNLFNGKWTSFRLQLQGMLSFFGPGKSLLPPGWSVQSWECVFVKHLNDDLASVCLIGWLATTTGSIAVHALNQFNERVTSSVIFVAKSVLSLNEYIYFAKKAIRIITFSKLDAHTSLLFYELKFLKFPDLVFLQRAMFMFDYHRNLTPSAFTNFFVPVSKVHNYNTRLSSRASYYIPAVRTNYGKFKIRFLGPKVWNNLDESLKSLSFRIFKRT